MQTTDLIDRIKELPSVFYVSEEQSVYGYTVVQAYLNEERLIDSEDSLYEVSKILKQYNIATTLFTNEESTYWQWIL